VMEDYDFSGIRTLIAGRRPWEFPRRASGGAIMDPENRRVIARIRALDGPTSLSQDRVRGVL